MEVDERQRDHGDAGVANERNRLRRLALGP
jgi:hypothetical protein